MNMENNKKMLHLFQLLVGKECSHCLFLLYDDFTNQQKYV